MPFGHGRRNRRVARQFLPEVSEEDNLDYLFASSAPRPPSIAPWALGHCDNDNEDWERREVAEIATTYILIKKWAR